MSATISTNNTPHCSNRACQAESFGAASSFRVPHAIDLLGRAKEHINRHGIRATLGKMTTFVERAIRSRRHPTSSIGKPRTIGGEVLNLQPGELVEVKSREEISATLDDAGSLKGLMFLPAMEGLCGKRFVVLKRLERMYQEESGTLRRMKNTVLLERAMCDGLLMRCDRSCFFYWREAWLRRVSR